MKQNQQARKSTSLVVSSIPKKKKIDFPALTFSIQDKKFIRIRHSSLVAPRCRESLQEGQQQHYNNRTHFVRCLLFVLRMVVKTLFLASQLTDDSLNSGQWTTIITARHCVLQKQENCISNSVMYDHTFKCDTFYQKSIYSQQIYLHDIFNVSCNNACVHTL